MQVSIRTIAVTALVALLVPVAAVAKDAKDSNDSKVKGPAALVGAGFFGGELELAMADGSGPSGSPGGRATSACWTWRAI